MNNDYNADALDAYESKIGFIKGFLANAVCRNGEKPEFTTIDVNYRGDLIEIWGIINDEIIIWTPRGKAHLMLEEMDTEECYELDLITNILNSHEPEN